MLSLMRILWIFLLLLGTQFSFGNTTGVAGEALVDLSSLSDEVGAVKLNATAFQTNLPEFLYEFLDSEETEEENLLLAGPVAAAGFLVLTDRVLGQRPFLDRSELLPRGKKYLLFQSLRLYC